MTFIQVSDIFEQTIFLSWQSTKLFSFPFITSLSYPMYALHHTFKNCVVHWGKTTEYIIVDYINTLVQDFTEHWILYLCLSSTDSYTPTFRRQCYENWKNQNGVKVIVIVRAVRVRIVQILREAWKLVCWFSLTFSTFWPIVPKNRYSYNHTSMPLYFWFWRFLSRIPSIFKTWIKSEKEISSSLCAHITNFCNKTPINNNLFSSYSFAGLVSLKVREF